MKELGRYDTSVPGGMFVESPRTFSAKHLMFERWLVDHGRGEHSAVSLPAGELAMAMAVKLDQPIETIWRQQIVGKD